MNYAFIDSQNLNLGIKSMGWKLDFQRFRIYLREKYKIETAYLFIGYSLVKFLYQRGHLGLVMSPYKDTCSSLLKKTAREKLVFMDNLRNKLEYKRKAPPKYES